MQIQSTTYVISVIDLPNVLGGGGMLTIFASTSSVSLIYRFRGRDFGMQYWHLDAKCCGVAGMSFRKRKTLPRAFAFCLQNCMCHLRCAYKTVRVIYRRCHPLGKGYIFRVVTSYTVSERQRYTFWNFGNIYLSSTGLYHLERKISIRNRLVSYKCFTQSGMGAIPALFHCFIDLTW